MSDAIVILGAGPAGLACAYKILKESKKKVIVIDKAPFVGGAGASFKWKGHILDYGPHAFHTRGDDPEKLIRDLFSSDPGILIEGRKQVHVYLNGRRFKYPLQVSEALLKFNPLVSVRIVIEFLLTSVFHAIVSIPIDNFENWGRKRFGSKLYQLSFGDYTEKVWKTKPNKISEKFASEKIQGFNFIDLIKRLLRIGGQVTEPYYQTWIYHKYGSGKIYERLAEEIVVCGGQILLETSIRSIKHEQNHVTAVTIERNDVLTDLPSNVVVSTITLPQLVSLLGNDLPFTARHSASKLSYTSLILIYIEFAAARVSDDHWFYLLEKEFRFNRVTEQKNLSPFTMESGKTVLMFELTCRQGDQYWSLSDKELFALAEEDIKKIYFVRAHKITDYIVKRVPNVYEIYLKNFDQHADLVLSCLNEFDNLVSIGRRGLFLQGDMHQSVEMGLRMASILSKDLVEPSEIASFYRRYVRYTDDN